MLELRVERLTYGPDALAREPGGRVVFLDAGLPGDLVRARVTEERRDYARAHVIEVKVPGEMGRVSHRKPPCPIVKQCGGCPWQHIGYPAQLEQKLAVALREIERVAGVRPREVLPSVAAPEWRSRSRIRLAVSRRTGGEVRAIGYRTRGSRRVVATLDCAISAAALVEALPAAHAIAANQRSIHELELLLDDRGALFLRAWSNASSAPDANRLLDAARAAQEGRASAGPVGLRVERSSSGDPEWIAEAGDCVQHVVVAAGVTLHVPLGAFTQVSLAQNRRLVGEVLCRVEPGPGTRILDLYCGAGNFAIPMALAGAAIVGVEANGVAAAAARANAERLEVGSRGKVAVIHAPVERTLSRPDSLGAPDLVVLDPPRAGVGSATVPVARLRAPTLVYVSCDVSTFARDARVLSRGGYRLESFQIVDLTPQTYRAESIGVFRLT